MLSNTPRGFYLMHRGWLDHSIFIGSEYDKRAAWVHLIEMASHNDQAGLRTGQLYVTYRRLVTTWGWSLSRVKRFMDSLRNENMIILEARDRKPSIVTICNYSLYQHPKRSSADSTETHFARLAAHQRNTSDTPLNEFNQNQELNNNTETDRQRLEELSVILSGFLADHKDAPGLLNIMELRRWAEQYSWRGLVIPTMKAWAKRNRQRQQPTIIRSWSYFTLILEKTFEKQRMQRLNI
ncbi:MAG: hypothetical protein GXP16_08325 [Gammaproteobacteria bacterium]|nr:hypothetical protein [Gammaproteobacteria bacterium]